MYCERSKPMCKVLLIIASIILSACAGKTDLTKGQVIGIVGGGVIGTYVGNYLGSGSGNLLFMVAGASLGGLTGYAYGNELVPSDRAEFKKSAKVAMDRMKDGEVYSWVNKDTGIAGTIKPTRSYYAENGKYCREFLATISTIKTVGKADGLACKIGANAWFINSQV